ncbi:hypothetical protein Droror1_Dr00003045 [Drosera rotundifolia]
MGSTCLLALICFALKVLAQYFEFNSTEDSTAEETESGDSSMKNRPFLRLSSFRELMEFVDKKEAEVKEILRSKKSMVRRPGDSSRSSVSDAQLQDGSVSDGQVQDSPTRV